MGIIFGSARTLLFLAIIGWCVCIQGEEITSSTQLMQRRSRVQPGGCASNACDVCVQSLGDATCKEISLADEQCIQDCIEQNPKQKCWMASCNNGEQCSMSLESCGGDDDTIFYHTCTCNPGFYGDGESCTDAGIWGVTIVLQVDPATCGEQSQVDEIVQVYANLLVNGDASAQNDASIHAAATADFAVTAYPIDDDQYQVTITVLFMGETAAMEAVGKFNQAGNFLSQVNSAEKTVTLTTAISAAALGDPATPVTVTIPNDDYTLQLIGTQFKSDCQEVDGVMRGCWMLDVRLPAAKPGSKYSLYVPKAAYTNISPDGGEYTAEELATFSTENFPCKVQNEDPLDLSSSATACCLEDFAAKYRPVQGFFDWVGGTAGGHLDMCNSTCPPLDEVVCDNWLNGADSLATNLLLGTFAGLQNSYVAHKEDDNVVRIFLDEQEFWEQAAQVTETGEKIYYLTTFIGLAQFSCDGNLILESSAFQLMINVEKSDDFAIATHGTTLNSFLEYINVRASEIDTWTQPVPEAAGGGEVEEGLAEITLQWATISFTVSGDFRFDGSKLDTEKISIGRGTLFDNAEWIQPCRMIWQAATIVEQYDTLMDQWCAPDLQYCMAPTSTPEGFVTLHVPLGEGYFATGADAVDQSLFVQMEISVVDQFGRDVVNILSASVPLKSSRNRYCEYASGSAELLEVANADLWVGTVGTQGGLDANLLQVFNNIGTDITTPAEPSAVDTKSIESGMMTLILRGDDDYFNLERSGQYSLELEDVYTIHIMESTDTMYKQVYNLVKGGKAWRIFIDPVSRVSILEPTPELGQLCPFAPPSATFSDPLPVACISRRDLASREPRKSRSAQAYTVVELGESAAAMQAAEDFMVTILGDNDFAKALGRNYSSLVVSNNGINGRYKRAWWINPGYEWAPALTRGVSVFKLSQRLIMGALINLNEEGVGSRRMILQSGAAGGYLEGIASANLVYAVDPSSLLANILDLSDEEVTSWEIEMQLTEAEACMDGAQLRAEMKQRILSYLEQTASPVKENKVQIFSLKVDRVDVVCSRRRSGGGGALGKQVLRGSGDRRVAYSKARGIFETVIAFEPVDRAYLDVKAFSEMPGVLGVAALASTPEGFAFSEARAPGNGEAEEGAAEEDEAAEEEAAEDEAPAEEDASEPEDSGSSALSVEVIAGVAAGAVVLALALATVVALWRRVQRLEQAQHAQPIAGENAQTFCFDSQTHQLRQAYDVVSTPPDLSVAVRTDASQPQLGIVPPASLNPEPSASFAQTPAATELPQAQSHSFVPPSVVKCEPEDGHSDLLAAPPGVQP